MYALETAERNYFYPTSTVVFSHGTHKSSRIKMSTHYAPIAQYPPPTQYTNEAPLPLSNHATTTRRKDYKPRTLRTPYLIAFSIFTLSVFITLQISAAAFLSAPGVHSLASRQLDTPPSPSSTPPPTAPNPGSRPDTNAWKPDTTFSTSPSPMPTLAPNGGSRPDTNPWNPDTISSSSPSPIPTPPSGGAPNGGSYSDSGAHNNASGTTNTVLLAYSRGWKRAWYFPGGYAPTLLAVVLGIWWTCVFTRLKEMEPFYQHDMSLSYADSNMMAVLYRSFVARHWSPCFGALNMVLVTICTLFAAETVEIASFGDSCGISLDDSAEKNEGCRLILAIRPVLAWVLGAVLVVVAVLTVCLVVRMRRQRSGVYADPTSIAGVACLLSDSSPSTRRNAPRFEKQRGHEAMVDLPSHGAFEAHRRTTSHIAMHPAALLAFCLFLVGMLVMILYYRFISKPGTGNKLEDFLNSQSFGVKLFMTALGLLTKFYWAWIEHAVRSARPYIALASAEGATAAESVLLSSPAHPVTAMFRLNTWSNFLLAMVTLMAVMSEVLIILLGGIPFSPAVAHLAFNLSVYISVGILAGMVAVVIWVVLMTIGKRRCHELPKIPEGLDDVLQLLADDKIWGVLTELSEGGNASQSPARFALRRVEENGAWRFVVWTPFC